MSGRISPTVVAMLAEGKISQAQARAYEARSTRLRAQTREKSEHDLASRDGGEQRTERLGNLDKPPTKRSNKSTSKMGWLYKLTNTVNGKSYVGQTKKKLISKRMDGHRTAYRRPGKGCRALNAAIVKYGWNAFSIDVLGRFPTEQLDHEEEQAISKHNTLSPHGYNILPSATFVPMHSSEVRERRAITMLDAEPRRKISEGVKNARKNRPDWIANQTSARLASAERQREAKMKNMTAAQRVRYLKDLEQSRASNRRCKAKKRTLASSYKESDAISSEYWEKQKLVNDMSVVAH